MENTRPQVIIYSDGGAKPNPGPGGWAALLMFDQFRKEISGGEFNTTNNQMELTAAIEALETLNQPCDVTLYTDSEYLKNGITQWMKGWVKKGWRTASGGPVKNQELWERLHEATQRHRVTWKWVRGHAGHQHNERVDQLATAAREKLMRDRRR
jgi:ribonuclease HI